MFLSLLLISAILLLLWGAGSCVLAAAGLRTERFYYKGRWALPLAVPLSAGLLLNYFLSFFLKFGPLLLVMAGTAAAGTALAYGGHKKIFTLKRRELSFIPAFLLIFLTVHGKMLGEPLKDRDATTIWFFHAKILFSNDGRIFGISDFEAPAVAFSHPDYPMLVPVLAAQITAFKGYWNGFLPKAALSVMFFLLLLYLTALSDSPRTLLWLAFLSYVSTRQFSHGVIRQLLVNGYMDGLLAVFCLVISGFLTEFFLIKQEEYPSNSMVCLLLCGIIISIKNEGCLWIAAAGLSFLFVMLRYRPGFFSGWARTAAGSAGGIARFSACGALSFSGFLCWKYYCHLHGLYNDLFSSPFVSNGIHRLASDPLAMAEIFQYVLTRTNLACLAMILAAGCLASCGAAQNLSFRIWNGALAAAIYAGMLFLVYLASPLDELLWRLQTGADRVVLPAKLAVVVAIYLLAAENLRLRMKIMGTPGTTLSCDSAAGGRRTGAAPESRKT